MGSLKNSFGLLGGEVTKNQYKEGNCLKRESWTLWRFKGGPWQKNRGGGVEGGLWYPNAQYGYFSLSTDSLQFKDEETCMACKAIKCNVWTVRQPFLYL